MIPETVIEIGAEGRLRGVLALPDASAPLTVFLASAATPHVGSHRVHVELARALARRGFPSLRFDVTGSGDDPNPRTDASYWDMARRDTVEVLDGLAAAGRAQNFVLVGHCDGAGLAFSLAAEHPRVIGVVSCDGFSSSSARYRAARAGSLALVRIRRALGRVPELQDTTASVELARASGLALPAPAAPWLGRAALPDLVERVRARGIPALWITTDEYRRYGDLRGLLRVLRARRRALPPTDEHASIDGGTHMLPVYAHRAAVVERVTRWFEERFPDAERRRTGGSAG